MSSVADANEKWSGPFVFIQGADTQLGMIENYLEKKADPRWEKELELTRRTIEKINAMTPKPAFFVVCGDLVDAFPGDPKKPLQVADLKRVLSALDKSVRLVCVCGNHDIGNEPTKDAVDAYRRDFGDDYFSFCIQGVLFIVINSQYFENRQFVKDYAEEQDKWLDSVLSKAKKYKHAVIFQHIPWFLRTPDEDDEYFNIEKSLRSQMLEKFNESGITAIFCGHYHRNAGGRYKNIELVVTSAIGAQLGEDKSGVRVVKVLDGAIQHQYYAIDDIPKEVSL